MLLTYTDLLTSEAANETAAEFVRGTIRQMVRDPARAEVLCPRGYAFGTKRPCLDTGYYDTFNRDHVSLVDLQATPLAEITKKGVGTSERAYECDALVLATGFDAMTGSLLAIDIAGRDGLPLREKWATGPSSYLGVAVAGFPNLFTITGPGSPSVLSNMIVSIEQHVDWIGGLLAALSERGLTLAEPDEAAEREWTDHVRVAGEATLYAKTASWYTGANVPGKPRVFMPYIGGVGTYRLECDEVAASGYQGFTLS